MLAGRKRRGKGGGGVEPCGGPAASLDREAEKLRAIAEPVDLAARAGDRLAAARSAR
jgi:hypothetical protein